MWGQVAVQNRSTGQSSSQTVNKEFRHACRVVGVSPRCRRLHAPALAAHPRRGAVPLLLPVAHQRRAAAEAALAVVAAPVGGRERLHVEGAGTGTASVTFRSSTPERSRAAEGWRVECTGHQKAKCRQRESVANYPIVT